MDKNKILLYNAVKLLIDGDVEKGKDALKTYIKATNTIGIIASELNCHVSSVRRMVGPKGNPTIQNMFGILKACQRHEGYASSKEFLSHMSR